MSEAPRLPFHLRGNYAPVFEERSDVDLPVEGAIPPELSGLFVRNGANPQSGTSPHWFLGDGMVHGLRLEGGRARWYRNRYVRTPAYLEPERSRFTDQGIDHTVSKANTHVLAHAGRLLCLEEGSFPYEIDAALDTIGPWTDDGRIDTAFTAHPHVCPETGELFAFGYGQLPPYLVYYRVSPDGKVLQRDPIDVRGPTMIHDFMISRRHAIFMDLPVVFDMQDALAGSMPYHWSDDYGARIGIMPREGRNQDVRWFEIEPCYVFHTVNAWEEGDVVVLDVCRISELWRKGGDGELIDGQNTLHRFRFDLATGAVKEETLDDREMDFPRIADARVGLPNRHVYTLQIAGRGSPHPGGYAGHLKFDLATGRSEHHAYGEGVAPGEPVFVAAPGGGPDSDAGWVLSWVYDDRSGRSEVRILDASRFTAPPIARIPLPVRVPFGFHGSWVDDDALGARR